MVNVIDPETELTSIEMQSHAIDSSKVAICINKRQDTKRLHGVSERCFSLSLVCILFFMHHRLGKATIPLEVF
jgi:hypothetical protein